MATEVDSIIEELFDKNPLIIFSVYTSVQAQLVTGQGKEILALLDDTTPQTRGVAWWIDPAVSGRVYGMFWFWVLGAYEVVRTMCQAKGCFTDELAGKLATLKGRLELLRMPFAKQELKGKRCPIQNEPGVVGYERPKVDLKFKVNGEVITVRQMIEDFHGVFSTITRSDVLQDHRASYEVQCDQNCRRE